MIGVHVAVFPCFPPTISGYNSERIALQTYICFFGNGFFSLLSSISGAINVTSISLAGIPRCKRVWWSFSLNLESSPTSKVLPALRIAEVAETESD